MNVSLTRGKKALYILCHVESLKVCIFEAMTLSSLIDGLSSSGFFYLS